MTSATQNWNEKQLVENRLIDQLKHLGYQYIHGKALDAERETIREVVLENRLAKAIKRINPWISDNNLRKVIRYVTHIEASSLMEANERLHEDMVHYISIEQDIGRGKKNQTVKLIDFDNIDNNEFLVVNQFKVSGVTDNIIPDVILFVNGIPLVVMECKSAFITSPIAQAVKQLQRYQRDSERLFYYNQILIATCGQQAKYAAVGAKLRHYREWKDPYPLRTTEVGDRPNPQDILVAGMLTKKHLLDLVQNFIVYEPEGGKTIKKLARYQQFRAVNKAIERIRNAATPADRGGVVWHTQGSGKSLTMLYLSVKLRRVKELENPTIVIVTDRKDLDTQITNTFRRCGFPNPQQAGSVAELRERLKRGSGATLMTTVQKFQDAPQKTALSTASNIFVLVDESHRTQYKGLATNMRTALPNACYLGFTGTPIDKKDKSTTRTFGSYIDTYTIQQAVDDGATVPILYEGRLPELSIEGKTLDALFDRMFQLYSEEDRERIKKKYANEEAITGAPKRIEAICLDILEHYETHIAPNGFKAQIVAVNRETAVLYKKMLDKLNGPESVVIISGRNSDTEELKKFHLSKEQQKHYIERFKKPLSEDALAFIIVCDMLLTGFDAPVEQVMYLDKPLKEHNLLQAIARVNRTCDQKDYGLIVDYYGVSGFLKQALGVFKEQDVRGAMLPIESELPRLQTRHRAAMRFFDYTRKSDLEACLKVLEPEDVRTQFDIAFKKFSSSMDMIMPNPAANPYREDLKFLGKVRLAAKQRFRDEEMDISDCGEKVKQLIEEYIQTSHVSVLHEPVDILSSWYMKKIDQMASDEAKASEMEHAIRHEIRVKLDENPVFYTSLREKLEQLIQGRKEERIESVQLVLELKELINQMRGYTSEAEKAGLTREEYPFYLLLQQELAQNDDDHEAMKDLTQIIVEDVSTLAQVVEWTEKADVQREMRKRIKRQLRASKCPTDKLESLPQKVLDLARVHFKK
ncbi:type I restriction endonuclease subunit R [Paenactinomyces guangxiensis]|uniref:Type I restriction enzyme endonuclease subunit n=1 Tax=Paenactinomyces guangxiensis TaxID=1490290 RepID=A0A7W2AA43_9BACL|nr:type I restriction endonuclease subunit R [Paenactinomyces guangxiensis]MBA4496400.1 type I restriction endonuclease subunit R [Paenactinomyces guangxiensis]MBH8593471.1 type I restriction endonuclease subunit R [Paenactinomyces guangxiensis]